MRTWRVGTFSMGAALLFLGIFLLVSQIFSINMKYLLIAWWPVILVILGIEILVFLFLSRQENSFLKYDFLSIFLVGMVGTAGIGLSLLNSTGILEKMEQWLNFEERTMTLPVFDYQVMDEVKRIVVDTGYNPITIEGGVNKEVSIIGTYRAFTGENEKLISKAEDYVSARQKGDTLYVSMKELPSESVGPFDSYADLSATILVPNNVELEVVGNDNTINIKPRLLISNWTVDRAGSLSVQIDNTSDVKITAREVQYLQGDRQKWNIVEDDKMEEGMEEPAIKEATLQNGNGSHHLQIMNSTQVSVNIID